jgi:coenzyme PQQ synthesis protein D (PqqD)/ion channel inhibitory toxin
MNKKAGRPLPDARKEGLVIRELADEILVYDLQRHRAHCLNHTAAWIWKRCDGRTTAAELARLLQAETKAPVDESIIWLGLDQLERDHLLSGRIPRHPATPRLSRRELVRQLGLAAAITLPLVTSIVAPTASQAASCVPAGGKCTNTSQCCAPLNCHGTLKICV